jgi:hypothetical protein
MARPREEKERASQNELFRVLGNAQAVEQSLASVATQHEVEILVAFFNVIEESLAHGRRDVAGGAAGHVSISR